jgi:hypothetical protein
VDELASRYAGLTASQNSSLAGAAADDDFIGNIRAADATPYGMRRRESMVLTSTATAGYTFVRNVKSVKQCYDICAWLTTTSRSSGSQPCRFFSFSASNMRLEQAAKEAEARAYALAARYRERAWAKMPGRCYTKPAIEYEATLGPIDASSRTSFKVGVSATDNLPPSLLQRKATNDTTKEVSTGVGWSTLADAQDACLALPFASCRGVVLGIPGSTSSRHLFYPVTSCCSTLVKGHSTNTNW